MKRFRTVFSSTLAVLTGLFAPSIGCQTTTTKDADFATQRLQNPNPHDRAQKEQRVEAHATLPAERVVDLLRARVDKLKAEHESLITACTAEATCLKSIADAASSFGFKSAMSGGFLVVETADSNTAERFDVIVPLIIKEAPRGTPPGTTTALLFALSGLSDARGLTLPVRMIFGANTQEAPAFETVIAARPAARFRLALDGIFPVTVGEMGWASARVVIPLQKDADCSPSQAGDLMLAISCPPNRAQFLSPRISRDVVTVQVKDGVVRVARTLPPDSPVAMKSAGWSELFKAIAASHILGAEDEKALSWLARAASGELSVVDDDTPGFPSASIDLNAVKVEKGRLLAAIRVRMPPPHRLKDIRQRIAEDVDERLGPGRAHVEIVGIEPVRVGVGDPVVSTLLGAWATAGFKDGEPQILFVPSSSVPRNGWVHMGPARRADARVPYAMEPAEVLEQAAYFALAFRELCKLATTTSN